ncbi:uncharacterized protein A4U43_C05F32780 [Asparagus officinalis]|uniref:Rab-GAP TBC domain-containing protein n=1 Tax=Asparagus officinalis TaxID=4686 RepID=A0A5P1EWC6_ASPOF|nr:uncharacterized protein A4U43_C05F32780 [Asparagus officinalis]
MKLMLTRKKRRRILFESLKLSVYKMKHKQLLENLNTLEWIVFLDSERRIMDSKALRKRIFYGGVEHGLRKEAYDSTFAEQEYLATVKRSEYEIIKSQWQNISATQARWFTKFRERGGLIEKDIVMVLPIHFSESFNSFSVRSDRSVSYFDGDDNPHVGCLLDVLLTYSFYNFDLGYCQGMSDFLSPILFVMEDDSESFWCFVAHLLS